MQGMLDPATLAALAIGVMTGVSFMLVAAFVEAPSARRFRRRLDKVKIRSPRRAAPASEAAPARSLTRRGSATPKMDRLAGRWLPRRELLTLRLERTGRRISIGQYMLTVL